jgi:Transposase DDE domain
MRAVSILRRWLSPSLAFVHAARANALWAAVDAVVAGGVLSLTAMGRACRRAAKPKHRIKAMDRLLGNEALHAEIPGIYAVVAWLLVRQEHPVILIDWTQVGARHWALAAAVPIGGRALPISVEVHPAKHLGNVGVQARFLERLRRVLPEGCCPILVSDAGFTTRWFDAVARLGWDFIGRVRGQRRVRRLGTSEWIPNKTLHAQATTTPRDLGTFEISRMYPRPRRLILVRQRRGTTRRKRIGRRGRPLRTGVDKKYAKTAREPWLLTTSLNAAPQKVAAIYTSRMQIEELFRDAKNHRFGWSLGTIVAHANSAARLQVLFLVAALGIVAMTVLGMAGETAGLHRGYQANTVRNRRVLSLFVLGTLIAASGRPCLSTDDLVAALELLHRRVAASCFAAS